MSGEIEDLTGRERECLYLATQFMRPKEIASQLGISPRTVETHLSRAVIKLGASNPRDAAKLYADQLAKYGSGKPPTETSRLADSLTNQSPMLAQHDAGQTTDRTQEEARAELLESFELLTPQSLSSWPWKRVEADDLSAWHRLIVILVGTILAAVAIIVVIAMGEAFGRLASTIP